MAASTSTTTKNRSKPTTGWFSYGNPWETWSLNMAKTGYYFARATDESNIPPESELDKTLPVKKYQNGELEARFNTTPDTPNGIKFMWIGHASCLLKINGITVLTDPVFNEYCTPSFYSYNLPGAKRYRPVPCEVNNLPKIDTVIISHNHYDHLDKKTVIELNKKFGNDLQWYVPKGMKSWITSKCGKAVKCTELSWWDKEMYKIGEEEKLKFVLTPAQHWCGRAPPLDYNKVLWGSWCVISANEQNPQKFFFGGDTGYCPAFKEIGDEFGPFDLAAIPVGAYHPREGLRDQHVDPEEAFKIHCDIKSKESIGIHWGTFKLTFEYYLGPGFELYKAREKAVDEGTVNHANTLFYIINHGEIIDSGRQDILNKISENSFISSENKNCSEIEVEITENHIPGAKDSEEIFGAGIGIHNSEVRKHNSKICPGKSELNTLPEANASKRKLMEENINWPD